MFQKVDHPGIGRYLTPGLTIEFSEVQRVPAGPAPRLGEHTDEILSEVLGLSPSRIHVLREEGLVSS